MKTPEQTKPDDVPQVPTAPSPVAPQALSPKAPEADEPDDGRLTFVVTPRAGPRVAGRRVRAQEHIRLTEEEAASELLTGAIVRKGERLHPQLLANAKPQETESAEEKPAL